MMNETRTQIHTAKICEGGVKFALMQFGKCCKLNWLRFFFGASEKRTMKREREGGGKRLRYRKVERGCSSEMEWEMWKMFENQCKT